MFYCLENRKTRSANSLFNVMGQETCECISRMPTANAERYKAVRIIYPQHLFCLRVKAPRKSLDEDRDNMERQAG